MKKFFALSKALMVLALTFNPMLERMVMKAGRKKVRKSGRSYTPNGLHERVRRVRQINAGQLTVHNGLAA